MFAPSPPPGDEVRRGVRKELATRTIFKHPRPAHQPGRARCQVIGVYSKELVRPIAEALVQLAARRAFVVHGAGGLDELSPVAPNDVLRGQARQG